MTCKAVLGAILTTVLVLPAQAQVMRCAESMQPIADDSLQRAAAALLAKDPQITFQQDDQPCSQARNTSSALARTVGRNYLTRVSGFEFVNVQRGDSYFTIERFRTGTPGELRKLETALNSRKPRKLKIEANTRYDVFVAGDMLVLMVSSAVGSEENVKLFRHVQQLFQSVAPVKPPPAS
jgi:hypothetical protein